MLESEREKVRDINRELMIANSEYEDLKKKLDRLGKMIYKRKIRIDNLLNSKENKR